MSISTQECKTIQLLEPDDQLLVATSSGSADPTLDESGDTPLAPDMSEVTVTFQVTKAGDYRFEYLYIDAFGEINPGGVIPIPITQTLFGFTVDLASLPITVGYTLRWRVVVIAIGFTPSPAVDTPASFYLQLPMVNFFTVVFAVPRSTTTYGFSELRVENLTDPRDSQTPILAQVVQKTQFLFGVALSPTPNTNNYYLVARTP